MNIAGIIWDAVNIYDGIAAEIYISGCEHNCPGCHNPEMQNFNYGEKLDLSKLLHDLINHAKWFDIIAILGGDLLCQEGYEAYQLAHTLKLVFQDKKIWLFTGKDKEEIPKWCCEIFDVIKVGKYIQELKQENGLGSSNQKLLYKRKDY